MNDPRCRETRFRWARRVSRVFMDNAVPGSRGLGRVVTDVVLPAPTGPEVVPSLFGFSLWVDPLQGGIIDAVLYRDGVYEIGTCDVARALLREGDVVVDAGAHIGWFTLAAATLVGERGRVVAFEPAADAFRILERNVALNGLRNVVAVPRALGAGPDARHLYHPLPADRALASLVEPARWAERETVTVVTLDASLASAGIDRVAMLKIDVEGWEADVLAGARSLLSREDGPAISVELDRSDPAGAEVFDMLRSVNRYRVFRRRRGKGSVSRFLEISRSVDLPERDNLYAFLPHHLPLVKSSRAGVRSSGRAGVRSSGPASGGR